MDDYIWHLELTPLERAALADNIPALLESLLYCARRRGETPGWVTCKSRDLIIQLLRREPLSKGGPGAGHLDRCRLDMMHARRYALVREIQEQQGQIKCQISDLRALVESHEGRSGAIPSRLKADLSERQRYAKAVGRTLNSACLAASRLLKWQGDLHATSGAVLKSYKLVEPYELSSRFYYPSEGHVLDALGIPDPFRPQLYHPEFERMLLGEAYQAKAPPRHYKPASATVVQVEPKTTRRSYSNSARPPWNLSSAPGPAARRDTIPGALKSAVQAGSILGILEGLHFYNRHGGHAPPWLMKAAAGAIIELLTRKPGRGRLADPLSVIRQRLLDCERARRIFGVALLRGAKASAVKVLGHPTIRGARAKQSVLRELKLLHGHSLDAAIRQAMTDLKETPLYATFAAAKSCFQRVRSSPGIMNQHVIPSPYIATALGLPMLPWDAESRD